MEESTHEFYENMLRRVLVSADVIMEACTHDLKVRQMGQILVSHCTIVNEVNLHVYKSTCRLCELSYE